MSFGVPNDEQLAKINRISKRTLSKDEVFCFSGKSAGDLMIPGRYTKLSPELLQVMADDAKKGVSFMLNHNWTGYEGLQGVPYGKVFDGRLAPSTAEGETTELYLDKYIFRDDEMVDGMSANALIKKIESGILSDTSIGFSTDMMTCSICGMNYYGRECSHYRGRTYELADGTKKVCTLTAMPPSVIIPYNNNALFEESIVWDGAYPGAMVTQSKHGDIIETPSGKFSIVDDKEELPGNTLFYGKYHNGNIVTMVKKAEHKKVYATGGISEVDKMPDVGETDVDGYKVIAKGTLPPLGVNGNKLYIPNGWPNEKLKGSESNMNENLLNALIRIGFTKEEAEALGAGEITTALNAIAEKWDATVQSIKDSVEPLNVGEGQEGTLSDEYLGIPLKEIKESLGADFDTDNILKLAKEGQEYHKSLADEAIAMGVRAMGNDFPADTWKASFGVMSTNNIKDIMATWELQANAGIPAGRKTDPAAGQGLKTAGLPDEAYKI